MPRHLETATLDQAARDYAGFFMLPNRKSIAGKRWISGPEWAKQDLFALTFKDEFTYVVERMRALLGGDSRAELDAIMKTFPKRDNKVFEKLLASKLALSLGGDHIDGKIGTTEIGRRVVGRGGILKRIPITRPVVPGKIDGEWKIVGYRERMLAVRQEWPVFAGEGFERVDGRIRAKMGVGPGADRLPEGAEALAVGANVTNMAAETLVLGLDAMGDDLDIGSTAATIAGRSGSQPADPDATEDGTLLFTMTCSDPAWSGATDDSDGTCSKALDSVTDDSSADATATLGYCRMKATGAGADDIFDGNAGTSDEAFVFNTVAIVSGSTVSLTSGSLGQSQGSTAS